MAGDGDSEEKSKELRDGVNCRGRRLIGGTTTTSLDQGIGVLVACLLTVISVVVTVVTPIDILLSTHGLLLLLEQSHLLLLLLNCR